MSQVRLFAYAQKRGKMTARITKMKLPFFTLVFGTGQDTSFYGQGTENVLAVLDDTNMMIIANVQEVIATGTHSGLLIEGPTKAVVLGRFDHCNVNLISDVRYLNVVGSEQTDVNATGDAVVDHVRMLGNEHVWVMLSHLGGDLLMKQSTASVAWVTEGMGASITLTGGSQNTIYGIDLNGATITVRNGQDNDVTVEHGDVTYSVNLLVPTKNETSNVTITDGDGSSFFDISGSEGSRGIYFGNGGNDIFVFGSDGQTEVWGGEGRDRFFIADGDGMTIIHDFGKGDKLVWAEGSEDMVMKTELNPDNTLTVYIMHDGALLV